MKLSRPTRDRLIAAAGAFVLVAVAVAVILIAKSCRSYTVTYYVGSEVVRMDSVRKNGKADNWSPEGEFDFWADKEGEPYDFDAPVTEDLMLYARFKE